MTSTPAEPSRGRALPDRIELYKVTVEEGRRGLDGQFAQLDSIRQRTVQYLAFVGAATAFLVGTAMKGTEGPRPWLFLTIAALGSAIAVVCLMLTWSILTASRRWWRPGERFKWDTSLSPRLLNDWIHPQVGAKPSEADFLQALADRYDIMISTNDHLLDAIRRRYRWFLGTGFAQLCVWIALISSYG